MKTNQRTRKEFLSEVSKWSATVVVGGTWLSACGSSSEQSEDASQQTEQVPTQQEAEEVQPAPSALEADACDDLSGLTEQEIALREQLNYVAQSEKEDQLCTNCRFWQPSEGEGTCGGCQLIKGPIHPDGWCASWVVMPPDAATQS